MYLCISSKTSRAVIINAISSAPRHNVNDLQRKLAEVNGYLSLLEDSMSGMVQQVEFYITIYTFPLSIS